MSVGPCTTVMPLALLLQVGGTPGDGVPESGEGSKDREALPPSQTVWLWLGNKGH